MYLHDLVVSLAERPVRRSQPSDPFPRFGSCENSTGLTPTDGMDAPPTPLNGSRDFYGGELTFAETGHFGGCARRGEGSDASGGNRDVTDGAPVPRSRLLQWSQITSQIFGS